VERFLSDYRSRAVDFCLLENIRVANIRHSLCDAKDEMIVVSQSKYSAGDFIGCDQQSRGHNFAVTFTEFN
jgi:hypothetical protein